MAGEYYHPLLIFGFWLEDAGHEVDWDRIHECIEILNTCVCEPGPSLEDSPACRLPRKEVMRPITRAIRRDALLVRQAQCPGCGIWADVDEDQWSGRVSLDCTECDYHETHNLSEPS